MDARAARFLISPEGRAAAAGLAGVDLRERRLVEDLKARLDADLAAALLDQELGRRSLEGRHPRARTLFTTREAAEQASSHAAARHHAARLAGAGRVADLGCGIGVDALALLEAGLEVEAVEADPARAVLARANLATHGARARVREGRFPELEPEADVIWADPDRRAEGRRSADPERADPPLGALLELARRRRGLGVKLSPLVDLARVAPHGEVAFVEIGGELKEIVLWTGEPARGRMSLAWPERDLVVPLDALPDGALVVAGEPAGYLLDPGPALRRSGRTAALAGLLGARLPFEGCPFAFADRPIVHPAFGLHVVEAAMPLQERTLRGHLAQRGVGRLDVTVRGADEDAERWRARLARGLRGDPAEHRRIFVTRGPRGRLAIVAIRSEPGLAAGVCNPVEPKE